MSRSSVGGRGVGRNEASTPKRDTVDRAAIAVSTLIDKSSAQCRSSATSRTGFERASSSIRSTLISVTAYPRSSPASNRFGSTSRSPARRARAPSRPGAAAINPWATAPGRRTTSSAATSITVTAARIASNDRCTDEVGLADPGLTFDEHDPSLAGSGRRDQLVELGELTETADRRRLRLFGGAFLDRPEMPAVGEASQAAPSSINEMDRHRRARQQPHDVGDENFASVGSASDARRSIDRCTERITVDVRGLTRVDPDPHLWRRTGKSTLRGDSEQDCLAR